MLNHSRVRVVLALFLLIALGAGLLAYNPQPSLPLAASRRDPSLAKAAVSRPPERIQPLPLPTRTLVPEQKPRTPRREETAPVATPELFGSPTLTHVVKPGESVASIAYRYLPQTAFMTAAELESAIRAANATEVRKHLHPGQQLIIPGIEPAPIVEHPVPKPKDAEVRAIYLTGLMAGHARGIELIRRWHGLGGNGVVFDVKDMDGSVSVPFDHPRAPRVRRPAIHSLPKFTRFLHALGLHAIARIALFRDTQLAERFPELAVRSRRTGLPWRENGKLVWVDPSRAEVQDYNLALAKRAASSGVDEIQFDYVRFPAEGDQRDAEFSFQSDHPEWERSTMITDFLKRAYTELHPLGVLVSLDVFGVMAWQRPIDLAHTGQDIGEMARYCDVLSPMVYPSHFFGMDGYARPGDAPEHFILASMQRFREITAGTGVVLRPWLQAFGWRTKTYSKGYILTQIDVAAKEGGIGFLFWNARNDYAVPFLALSARRLEPGSLRRSLAPSAPIAVSPASSPSGEGASH